MNLAFNIDGNLLKYDDDLAEVTAVESELYRLAMFFDTSKSHYFYDLNFGNNSNNLVGKSGLEQSDLDLFVEELSSYMVSSGILLEYTIDAIIEGRHSIVLTLTGGGDEFVWRYSTQTGRLTFVEDQTPVTQASYLITSEVFPSNGSMTYAVDWMYQKCKEKNGINEFETEIEFSHRLFILDSSAGQGDLTSSYSISDFDHTLTLERVVTADKFFRMELWPTKQANLETTTNPYLMRASWLEPTEDLPSATGYSSTSSGSSSTNSGSSSDTGSNSGGY